MSKMNNTRWSAEEKEFVEKHIGKLSFETIGSQIGRSELAVKLFVHRSRIPVRKSVRNNLLLELLRAKFGNPEYFTPTREFYLSVGITQMRFWALYRGEVQVSEREYKAIRKHLNIDSQAAFDARQLDLFENMGGGKTQKQNRISEHIQFTK